MAHALVARTSPQTVPAMSYYDGLDVRHKLARIFVEALMLIYSDGALSAVESDRVPDAIEVRRAL
jgi:hypothetical protein